MFQEKTSFKDIQNQIKTWKISRVISSEQGKIILPATDSSAEIICFEDGTVKADDVVIGTGLNILSMYQILLALGNSK